MTLLFVACAIYDPDEDYVGELRESGFGWPSCSFDAGWDDDQFCPSVFVGAAAENLFETVWLTVLCAPIVAVLDRMLEAIGAAERLRKQFQARASEIAAVGDEAQAPSLPSPGARERDRRRRRRRATRARHGDARRLAARRAAGLTEVSRRRRG